MLVTCMSNTVSCVTLVYNMRIAETTKAKNRALLEPLPSIAVLTPFAQFRIYDNPLRQSTGGILGTYIYSNKGFYARINAAGGRIQAHAENILNTERTQTDDILFSGGYGWRPIEDLNISLSGHLGIPTHGDDGLQSFQLGTGHVGLGAQIDTAYSLNDAQTVLGAFRFIHFFNRNVMATIGPICRNFVVDIGDVCDLLFIYQHTWGPHLLDVGYNPTFIFGAKVTPSLDDVFNIKTNVTINNFFTSYRYGFLFGTHISAIVLGLSYGFGNTPVPGDKVNIVTAWFSWGINF